MKSAGAAEANGEEDKDSGDGRHNPASGVWTDTMSTRFHIMSAVAGYQPSYLAIGDAFFYGRGGLPRYVPNAPLPSQYTLIQNLVFIVLLEMEMQFEIYIYMTQLEQA